MHARHNPECWCFQYFSRKLLKRDMRSLWITRINAASREHGLKYGDFANGLKLASIECKRVHLAEPMLQQPPVNRAHIGWKRDSRLKTSTWSLLLGKVLLAYTAHALVRAPNATYKKHCTAPRRRAPDFFSNSV